MAKTRGDILNQQSVIAECGAAVLCTSCAEALLPETERWAVS